MGGIAHELDELLGSVDAGLILAVKDTEAPDAAAQFSGAAIGRGEVHVNDLLAGDGLALAGVGRVRIELLGAVPAEGHLQNALIELGDLIAASQGSVIINALGIAQLGEGLDVLRIVPSISGVVGVGVCTAIEVVHQRTGALVAALACAEYSSHGLAVVGVKGINGLEEVLGRPGVGGQIHVLVSAGFFKSVQVDGHTVGGHAHGVLVHLAGGVDAGGEGGFNQLALVGVVQHVGQIHHVAVGAPVGDQTLRPFQNQVRRFAGREGGVDLVIAIGISQVLNLNRNIGFSGEGIGQFLDLGLVTPSANGVHPQADLGGAGRVGRRLRIGGLVLIGGGAGGGIGGRGGRVVLVAAGNKSNGHDHCQYECKYFLQFHVDPP